MRSINLSLAVILGGTLISGCSTAPHEIEQSTVTNAEVSNNLEMLAKVTLIEPFTRKSTSRREECPKVAPKVDDRAQVAVCNEIDQRMYRVRQRKEEVAKQQADEATNDAIALSIGLFFWPAFLFIPGNDKEEQLARLMGEINAWMCVAEMKGCKQLLEESFQEDNCGREPDSRG